MGWGGETGQVGVIIAHLWIERGRAREGICGGGKGRGGADQGDEARGEEGFASGGRESEGVGEVAAEEEGEEGEVKEEEGEGEGLGDEELLWEELEVHRPPALGARSVIVSVCVPHAKA